MHISHHSPTNAIFPSPSLSIPPNLLPQHPKLPQSDTLSPSKLTLGPLQMRIQHRAHPTLHTLNCLRQQLIQFFRRTSLPRPQIPTRCCFRYAGVVWGGGEGNVKVFICSFGAGARGVNEEEGAFRCIPT